MNGFHNLFGFFFVYLNLITLPIYAEDVCLKKGPCTCVFSNGTGVDLTPAANKTFYTAQMYDVKKNEDYELSVYYFHPCSDMLLNMTSTNKEDTCGNPLSICRHVNNMELQNKTTGTYKIDSGVYNYMGSINDMQFSADGQSIIYFNRPSQTVVLLICAETENQLSITSLQEPNNIMLSFYSKYACLRQIEEVGRSLGSTLLIIFFSFVIFYLVLGVCTKKFLMGATGLEVIPNLGFWSDLPNLVKDGWAFALNGFKLPARGPGPAASPDPNSYDSI